jgi:Flp pilus assembly protein TadG
MTAPPLTGRERGNASVEFVVLATLLLVPVVYLVLTLGRLQAAGFATDGAARDAVRAYLAAPDEATGTQRALAAVRLGLLDQGFDVDAARAMRLECSAAACLGAGGRVTVQVSVDVVLPGVPAALDVVVPTHVTVRSTQLGASDAFRAR